MVPGSVADDSYGRASFARSIELGEVNSLPRPKRELAIAHRQGHRATDQHRFHMSGTVSFGVRVLRLARNGPFERGEQVALHVGIGILVDEDAGGRMSDGDGDDAVGDLRPRDRRLHARGDVDRLLASLGRDRDALVANAHEIAAPAAAVACCAAMRPVSDGVALPPMRPPPPTGTTMTSTSGRSSTTSRPIVPCPEMLSGSAYGWTNVLPCSVSMRCARASVSS